MTGFIEGENRNQATLFPERLDDYIIEDNAVRIIDVFIDGIDLSNLGFKTVTAVTGRNLELMWLLGRLAPDFKTIVDFRKNNAKAIRFVCREFVMICRKLNFYLAKPLLPLMAASSKQSTTVIATSPVPR